MIRPVNRSTYVPHIDGLRAVAVLSVIVYHVQSSWLPAGLAGVDIFFVISGFVVSASLAELRTSTPAFFAYFYARRMLRILPALVVCLIATHVASMLFIPLAWLSDANQRTGLFAFFGLSNFVLATTGDNYFAPRTEFNPYTHTWSLGVEEQFYLIFPPLFAAWIAGGRRRAWSAALFALGLVASLICAIRLATSARDLAFYMLYCRFWELGAGVLLYQALVFSGRAFSETHRPATALSQGGAIGAALLLCAGLVFPRAVSFPYPGALLSVLGTLGLLAFLHGREPRGLVMRALRLPVVVFIGQISYSLYLWHWPVFVLFRWTVGLEGSIERTVALALTFGFAIASYYLVERPPRRMARLRTLPRGAIIAGGIALIAVSAGVAWRIDAHSFVWSLSRVARDQADWYPGGLPESGTRNCTLQSSIEPIGSSDLQIYSGVDCKRPDPNLPRLFVIGDSHALAYSTLLMTFAVDTGADVYLYANGGCPFIGLQPARETYCTPYESAAVADMLGRMRRNDILFLPSLRLNRLTEQGVPGDEKAAWERMFGTSAVAERQRAVDQAVLTLKPFAERGVKIVFEAPKPILRAPPFRCSDWFNATNPICAPGLTIERAKLLQYREPVMQAFAEIAQRVAGVRVWDPFPLLCPEPVCTAMRDGKPLFYDGDHVSAYADRLLAPDFERWIAQISGDRIFTDGGR